MASGGKSVSKKQKKQEFTDREVIIFLRKMFGVVSGQLLISFIILVLAVIPPKED